MSNEAKKLTGTRQRSVGVPVTRKEQYDKLKLINPQIEALKKAFDLDVLL